MHHKRSFISIVLATIVLVSLCAVCVSSASVSAAGNVGETSGAKTAGVATSQTLRDGTVGVIPELSWTQGHPFPVVSGRTIFPTLAPPVSPPAYNTHWYAGSDYQGPSETAQTIHVSIRVPYSAPRSDEFYYVLLSAWDSAGSYDQLGFSNTYGTWGLTYSWTSGPPDNLIFHYSSNAMALSVGATYTFGITTEGGVTHFIAYQDSTQVWSNDAPTGGNYLVLSSSYSGYADYTDYEEIWVTSTSGGSPAFDFYFYDNYWVPTGGGENAATWTSYYSGAPSNVAVIISGNSVLVHNPLATVLFETDPTSFAASPGTITFSGQTYSNGQTAEYADNSYQVTANAPTGYQFDHWEYSGSSGSGVYVANINANTTTVQVNGEGWLKAVFTVGSWGAWTSLGGQLLAGTSPAATNVSDQPYWFVTGTNHQLYYATTGSSSWTSLGGVLTSSPGATSPSAGVIDVFVRGTNGALYTRHYSGGVWGAWTSLGGQIPFGTSPAACSWGASREDVFVQGTNGALYQKTWTGTWSGWTNLGGVLTSSPGATSPSAGVIDVFVRGTNGALYTRHYSGGVWGAWTSLGGQIPAGTSPAACSWSASREDVFVQGTNGALYQKTSTSSGWSSSWTGLGGVLTSSPAATSPASGTIDVFVRGTNGALYERIYTGG